MNAPVDLAVRIAFPAQIAFAARIPAAARIAFAACIAGIALGQDPTAPPPQSAPAASTLASLTEKPAPPSAPVIDYTAHFDLASYEAALGGIAAAYPDLVRVKSLGKSREGKDIWLAVVADTAAGDPGRLPAALVTTSLRAPARGPEPALFALAQLLASARSDSLLRDRLREVAIYFLPAVDPDEAFPSGSAPVSDAPRPDAPPVVTPAAASPGSGSAAAEHGPEPRRARLDRDLPARWSPSEEGPGPRGPYPLAEPETRLLARFLVERPNFGAVVVMGAPGESVASAKDPAGTSVAELPCEPGSLEAFCLDVLDVAVVRPAPWSGSARASAAGSAPEGFHAAAALVRDLAEDLPRLECSTSKVERLRPDLWVVDLSVANRGRISSAGSRFSGTGSRISGAERTSRGIDASSVRLRTTGGRVVAAAVRREGAETFESLRPSKSLFALGDLAGKESLAVRLVVQADEGAAVEAVFEGARGGRAHAEVSLR